MGGGRGPAPHQDTKILDIHHLTKPNGQGHGLWREGSRSLLWKYVKPSSHLIRSIDSNFQICSRESSFGPQIFGVFQPKVPSFLNLEAILLLSLASLLGKLFPHSSCVGRGFKGSARSRGAREAPGLQVAAEDTLVPALSVPGAGAAASALCFSFPAAYPTAYAPISQAFPQQAPLIPQQQREGEGWGSPHVGPVAPRCPPRGDPTSQLTCAVLCVSPRSRGL